MIFLFVLVLVICFIWFIVNAITTAVKADKEKEAERKLSMKKNADVYVAEIKEQGKLPQISVPSLLLTSGEYVFLKEETNLKETRAVRQSSGGFGGVRIAKGITIGGYSGSSESHQEWRLLDSGNLILTSKKLTFLGEKENRTIPINKIMAVEASISGIEISIEGRTKGVAFSVKNPYIWNIAISILRSDKNPLDLKSDELNIELK